MKIRDSQGKALHNLKIGTCHLGVKIRDSQGKALHNLKIGTCHLGEEQLRRQCAPVSQQQLNNSSTTRTR